MAYIKKLGARLSLYLLILALLSSSCSLNIGGANSKSAASAAVAQTADTLGIYVIDVGNADSILVLNKGETLLIDAGENGDGDDVVNFIRSQGVESLNYVIATHPDADHIGGMDVVINEIPIDNFIMSIMPDRITPTTRTYIDMLEALDNKDVEVTEAVPGSRFTLGEAAVNILGPVGEFNSTNNMSVVCRIDFGEFRFLFMGDAENEAENALMKNNADVKADFIKIGHHGSSSSSQPAFIKAVSPSYAVISCGVGNRYKHPHSETLSLLKSREIDYYRTDINGTVTVLCDKKRIAIKTEKG